MASAIVPLLRSQLQLPSSSRFAAAVAVSLSFIYNCHPSSVVHLSIHHHIDRHPSFWPIPAHKAHTTLFCKFWNGIRRLIGSSLTHHRSPNHVFPPPIESSVFARADHPAGLATIQPASSLSERFSTFSVAAQRRQHCYDGREETKAEV